MDTPLPEQQSDSDPQRRIRYDQPWLTSFLRPFLIVVLVACLNVALIAFLHRLLPAAPMVYFQTVLLLGVVATTIGVITTTWLAQPSQRLRRTMAYRAAEVVFLLVIARLLLWIVTMQAPTFTEFMLHPIYSVVDGYFLVAIAVVVVSWSMAMMFSDDLLLLAIQPDEIYAAESMARDARDTSRGGDSGRQIFLNSFVGRWVMGGIVLVILASGTQLDLPKSGFLALLRQQIDPAVIVAVIVYFFAGLLLISQGQLALLRARWTIERIPSSEAVLRNWPGYVLTILVAVGLLAAIMPFGGTYYLSLIIGSIIGAAYAILFLIINFFMLLLLLLLSLLPFSDAPEKQVQQIMAEPFAPPPVAPPPEYLAWLRGATFWVLAAILLGYAAYVYFSGKGVHFKQLAWLWAMLKLRWRQLFGAYHEWRQARRVGSVPSAHAGDGSGGWRSWFERFNRRKLSPEQRIRYYYLTILEQAKRAGMARQRSETPAQYAPRLAGTLADKERATHDAVYAAQENAVGESVDSAIERLTDDFVRVRYAGQSVDDKELGLLERVWKQLRTALRHHSDA